MHSEITKDGLDVNGSVARPWRDISGQRAAASISAATSSVSDLPNLRGRAKKVLMAIAGEEVCDGGCPVNVRLAARAGTAKDADLRERELRARPQRRRARTFA